MCLSALLHTNFVQFDHEMVLVPDVRVLSLLYAEKSDTGVDRSSEKQNNIDAYVY